MNPGPDCHLGGPRLPLRRVVVGVGGRPGAEPGALLDLAAKALADLGLGLADVRVVTTMDRRADHEGVRRLLAAAGTDGARLVTWTAEQLAAQTVDHPSYTVANHVGTASVAEAAVRAAGATPAGPPVRADDWVVVVAHDPSPGTHHHGAVRVAHDPGPDLHHHGDVEVAPGMLDFAVNVHADRPPDFLREALVAAIGDLAGYPDPRPAEAVVAAAHGVPPESVLLTHGAAEAFTLVAQQPWRSPLVVHPQFTEPEAALLKAGHRPDRLLLTADNDFRLTGTPTTHHDLVLVGNPTNPTSRLHQPREIDTLGGADRLVVVDEAFMDAVEPVGRPRYSRARDAAVRRDLLVVRSLTKTFSIAGLRVGYLVGNPDLLAGLAARRTHWPVGTLAAAAAVACVSPEGEEYAAAVRAALPGRLAHLRDGLVGAGFTVPPDPRGPFVLAHRHDAAQVRESLRAQGIAVRRADTFPGLGPTWLRFAARDAAAVDVLLGALRRSSAPRRR